jgi:hypothetical protein
MEVNSINSEESWSIGEAIRFIKSAAFNEIDDIDSSDGDIMVCWTGLNRTEVMKELLRHGWVVTSMDEAYTWFEKLD